jgi:hypothetical protein
VSDIENLRAELVSLIEKAGSDYKASELLLPYCGGFSPDRSTLGKFRRGEGKPTLIAMTVTLLRLAIDNKLLVDRVGDSPYYVSVDTVDRSGDSMQLVSEDVFEIALTYRGIDFSIAKEKIEKMFEEESFEAAESQLSAYIAESGLYFEDQPEINNYRYYIDKNGAAVIGEGVMHGSRDIESNRMITHHNVDPCVELKLNLIFPEDDEGDLQVEFEHNEY